MAQILSVSHTVITNRLFFFFFLFFFYWSLVDLQCCVSFPFFYEVLEVSTQTKVTFCCEYYPKVFILKSKFTWDEMWHKFYFMLKILSV